MQNVPWSPLFVVCRNLSFSVILDAAFFHTIVEKACTRLLPLSPCTGKLSTLPST